MKNKLFFLVLLLFVGVCITSCDNDDNSPDTGKRNVVVEDFDLDKLSSQLGYLKDSVIYLVKSDNELSKLLVDGIEIVPSGIDYNKNSLLITVGYTTSNVSSLEKEFYYDKKEDKYILHTDVCVGFATMPDRWIVAILIPSDISETEIVLETNVSDCSGNEINFSDFDLTTLPCKPEDTKEETLYIINSDEEILSLFLCEVGSVKSGIDFDKKTLLLVRGVSNSGIVAIEKGLESVDKKAYDFNINIYRNDADIVEEWYVAVLVDKLNKDATINLNINKKASDGEEIIFINFDDSVLPCQWADLKNDSIYVINSNAEVGALLSCNFFNPETGIDFSKNTLLLVGGVSNNGIDSMTKNLIYFPSLKTYRLDVYVLQNYAEVVESWKLGLIVPKIEGEFRMTLNTIYSHNF